MSELDLDAIEARADAATEGPWDLEPVGDIHERGYIIASAVRDQYGDNALDFGRDEATGQFIARARTDVPALVAEVRRLRRVIRGMEKGRLDLEQRARSATDATQRVRAVLAALADPDGGAA